MPKTVIKPEPAEPADGTLMQTERIEGQGNNVVIGWAKRLGFVQIGVQEPDALPGERDGGHFTSLDIATAEQVVKALRQAIRAAGRA